jgi:hypothetical protein
MQLGEFINSLAQKAGVKSDDENLKSLLASPQLADIKVTDELISYIDKGLLNIEAAKNNHPDIKKKYFADAYDGMDKQLLSLIESDTFDQADLDEIKSERSTSKKAELIVSKLKAAKSKAKGIDKDEINAQLAIAHAAAKASKDETIAVKNDYENKIKGIYRDSAVLAAFANYKTIYDDLPGDIRKATMDAIINKSLQDKNAELQVNENGQLLLISKDGSNVFGSNHVQLTPQSFLDQSLAPILKVSGSPKPAVIQPAQRQQAAGTPPVNEDRNAGFLKSHSDQVLADMAASSVSMM